MKFCRSDQRTRWEFGRYPRRILIFLLSRNSHQWRFLIKNPGLFDGFDPAVLYFPKAPVGGVFNTRFLKDLGEARLGGGMVSTGLANGSGASGDGKSQVLQATDIVELISQTVSLKQRSGKFVGLCPFHQEKTPSFQVDRVKQYYYCFGCKKGGNAIDFVIERDRVDFRQALQILADQAGIDLPSFSGREGQKASDRQVLFDAQAAACLFFEKLLAHPQHGEAGRRYLAERGFTEESISRFHLGVAPDAWDGLLKSSGMKRFAPGQLAVGGLVKSRERGDGHYDTFRNRLMFPIRDETGRTIAFGGRVMPGSSDPAKYLNSPETPLFNKSSCMFGMDVARDRMLETRSVTVVEGYTDVVMAHQFGVTNVVSVLGTALTAQHISKLRRFVDRVVLLFDGDAAGDAAVNRAVELFLTQPIEISIATLPEGVDPDELLLRDGAAGFNAVIDSAVDALTYKWRRLVQQIGNSDGLTGKQHAVEAYLATLAAARGSGPVDSIRWGVALASVSRLTEIPTAELYRRFKMTRSSPQTKSKGFVQVSEPGEPNYRAATLQTGARSKAEGFIIGLLLLEPDRWDVIQHQILPREFENENLRQVAEIFWGYQQDHGEPVLNEFLDLLTVPSVKSEALRWMAEASDTADLETMLSGSLEYLADCRKRAEEQKLIAQIRAGETGTGEKGSEQSPTTTVSMDVLRQLQEKMKRPDLKRQSS